MNPHMKPSLAAPRWAPKAAGQCSAFHTANSPVTQRRKKQAVSLHRLGRRPGWSRWPASIVRTLRATWLRAQAGWVRWRLESETRTMLHHLDNRTLYDLGLDRSEVSSFAAEVARQRAGIAIADRDGATVPAIFTLDAARRQAHGRW